MFSKWERSEETGFYHAISIVSHGIKRSKATYNGGGIRAISVGGLHFGTATGSRARLTVPEVYVKLSDGKLIPPHHLTVLRGLLQNLQWDKG